ncbi:hypothetical protein CFK39_12665 [Brachybacterium avium]|uniref:DNA modification methylase n=1 Tax=Brachybacterium avium TaxID=2017485 RepID=A0A220UEU0_9MICO|nr:hypothetical protein [Brachybacterium avium]ASK66520.1 hypothetical protein CFK39_12665 [Brachybacterium avium]
MRRSRRSVLSAAALGLALAATGCTYMSPVQTKDFYQAADGTNATITQDDAFFAGVRDAVLVVADDGTPTFFGSVVSYADEEITVSLEGLTSEGSSIFSTETQVPAHGSVELGPGEGQQPVPIDATDVAPGTVLDLEVTADGQSTTISLPVLDGSLEYYEVEDPAAS